MAKTLKFAPELAPLILSGKKTVTWRLFDDKDIQAGDTLEFVNKENGAWFARARVASVREKKLGEVNDGDFTEGHERYANAHAMTDVFKKYYGDAITAETPLKIISFQLASDKYQKLETLRAKLAAATLPLMPANLVFGEGDPDADVMFIGEAPGANEDIERRPFVGRGGKLLNQMLAGVGWKRENVYITNIVKRRPPDNRDPLPDEIAAYKPYLADQIEIINPRVIVPLGRFSMNYFLPDAKITRDEGRVFAISNRIIYPVFHPAAALRNPDMMARFKASLERLPAVAAQARPGGFHSRRRNDGYSA